MDAEARACSIHSCCLKKKQKQKKEHNALWKLDPGRKIFKFKQIYALTLILSPHKDEFVCVTLYMLFYKWANILKKSGWKCGMFDEIQTLQLCGKWINLWPLIRSISPLWFYLRQKKQHCFCTDNQGQEILCFGYKQLRSLHQFCNVKLFNSFANRERNYVIEAVSGSPNCHRIKKKKLSKV